MFSTEGSYSAHNVGKLLIDPIYELIGLILCRVDQLTMAEMNVGNKKRDDRDQYGPEECHGIKLDESETLCRKLHWGSLLTPPSLVESRADY
jgi:hypothetical protein